MQHRRAPLSDPATDTQTEDPMTASALSTAARTTRWLSTADCSLDDFVAIVEQQTDLSDYPYADAVEQKVLIYGEKLRAAVGSAEAAGTSRPS